MFGIDFSKLISEQNKKLRKEIAVKDSIIESMDLTIAMQAELIENLERKLIFMRAWENRIRTKN